LRWSASLGLSLRLLLTGRLGRLRSALLEAVDGRIVQRFIHSGLGIEGQKGVDVGGGIGGGCAHAGTIGISLAFFKSG
jgi:4-diphosphocytidyl-2C-methyl-D-erythritol kinase